MKLCIAGKNDIAVNALCYLVNTLNCNKNNLFVILNRNDSGIDTWQKSLKKCAKELGIKILSLEDIYYIEDLYFISLEFDRIIKTEKFKTKKLYNIHFSKLPAYKGMYTAIMPVLNGEKEAGVTLHEINNGIDTGGIIAQKTFEIEINDTSRDLYFKFLKNSYELFVENIESIINGNYKITPQSPVNSSYYSKKAIDFNNIQIDFNKTSFEIHNQIRAFIFKEYQLPEIRGVKIKKSILTNEFIGFNSFIEKENEFIISGIDGYKIIALKSK